VDGQPVNPTADKKEELANDNKDNENKENDNKDNDSKEATAEATANPPLDDTVVVFESFDDMNLPDEILQGIYSLGFEKPSPIQKKAIVPLIKGRDIIAQSQSGTGKTGAFTIGCLGRVDPKSYDVQAIIISPTRELADQTYKVMQSLTKVLTDVKMKLAIGGTRVHEDIEEIRRSRPQILIGTPGRIMDLISRGAFKTNYVHTFILDEADEMLSRGFKLQIQDIFRRLPDTITTGLFSATLSPDTLEVTENFMKSPIKILINREGLTLEGIKQFYVDAEYEDAKLDCIIDIYKALNLTQTIVYTNTQKWCDRVTECLEKEGFPVRSIHAGMSQEMRLRTLQEFRDGSARILVTTNILARGIDIQQIKLVINYDLPNEEDFENYIHRIGRSGRYGRTGVAINLCVSQDAYLLKKIEQYFHTTIDVLPQNFAKLI
jgi:translation initiation factor 4A